MPVPIARPPQSEADDDQRLSRMALLQPREPAQPPAAPSSSALINGLDVDREKRTPSPTPGPAHDLREHDHHAEVPVRGQPRIFAAMGTEDPEEAQGPREQWEHETPLVRGKPRIFVAQEENEPAGSPEVVATSRQSNAYTQEGGVYTQAARPEKDAEEEKDADARAYPHTQGYPTPRSRSPVLSTERTVPSKSEDERGRRQRQGSEDGHRISRSLPPTPSPRAPSSEPQHDTDGEHGEEGSKVRRRLQKGGRRRGSRSQSDSEDDVQRRGYHFGFHLRGLGIFGVKGLTEKQVEKLGTKEPQTSAAASAEGAPVAAEAVMGASVLRRGSESDGRRRLRKESRRGRREEREGDGDSGFVHVDGPAVQEEIQRGRPGPGAPPTSVSPDDYARARAQRRGAKLVKALPTAVPQEPQELKKPSMPYPLVKHLLDPALLAGLLVYLDFKEWLGIARLNSRVRGEFGKQRALTECVLEKFLGVVGYARWTWGVDPNLAKGKSKDQARAGEGDQSDDKPKPPNDGEPLTLTLQVSLEGRVSPDLRLMSVFCRISIYTCAESPCRHISSLRLPLSTSMLAGTRTRSRLPVNLRHAAVRTPA